MEISKRVTLAYRDDTTVEYLVSVNFTALAQQLGNKARKSKRKQSAAIKGAVQIIVKAETTS
jgi:hypothetical protein